MESERIRINRIIKQSSAEGFGIRFCVWFQGCSIRCPGCMNSEMWTKDGGKLYEASEIVKDVAEQGDKIEGITILGGEPFDQLDGLLFLVTECKNIGYTVILFTGYVYEKLLLRNDKRIMDIFKNTDVLIDGPYMEEKRDFSRPWTGSSNQRYLFFTSKYTEKDLKQAKNRIELRILSDGKIMLNGMGNLCQGTIMK